MAKQEQRFGFGKNWSHFLSVLDDQRVTEAEKSLATMLGSESLKGKSFLDIGSGSGLFSLAAKRLGARVHSFDYDQDSVACTGELKRRFFLNNPDWKVEQGSALDEDYLKSLGKFDIVYSWGVLHHTGNMWKALDNAALAIAPGGTLFVSIYNDQGWQSKAWRVIKQVYNSLPAVLRPLYVTPFFVGIQGAITARDTLRGDPLRTWKLYRTRRGMSPWYDMVDWIGGYPFEVATPEQITSFYQKRGFEPVRTKLVGNRMGCNEFVFKKTA